jgi:hypothetical protein
MKAGNRAQGKKCLCALQQSHGSGPPGLALPAGLAMIGAGDFEVQHWNGCGGWWREGTV